VIELALKQSRAFEDRMLTAQASNGGGSVLGHAGDSGSAGKWSLCFLSVVFIVVVVFFVADASPL